MWSRLIFWCVFAAFVLNILQPGYMQFYDIRKPLVGFIAGLKMARQSPKLDSIPQTQVAIPTPPVVLRCDAPKNDYERILFAQGIGGCNASRN